MKLSVANSQIGGEIAVPGSKSHTIRGIAAGLMAEGRTTLVAPLESADTLSTLRAAQLLGAEVEQNATRWVISGTGGCLKKPGKVIDMGNSGTGLRMLTALAATADFEVAFDGDESLRTRLMQGELDALEHLGVRTFSRNGRCPLSVRGKLRGGRAEVDGTTSQFVSALLFAAAFAPEDTELRLPFLNEKPYVSLTLKWLEKLGIKLEYSDDLQDFKVFGNQSFAAGEHVIPADFSTSAFPLIAAAAASDTRGVKILHLDFSDVQGDKAVFGFLEKMGAVFERSGSDITVRRPANGLRGGVFDLNATPDALPAMAVAAAAAKGETQLLNAPQARVKETDRIACMTRELRKMGVAVEELPDGMVIQGGALHGSADLQSYGDHRIAMALAVGALCATSPSVIDGIECAAVTYPGFVNDFRSLGANMDVLDKTPKQPLQ